MLLVFIGFMSSLLIQGAKEVAIVVGALLGCWLLALNAKRQQRLSGR